MSADVQVGDLDPQASHRDLGSRAIAVPGFNPADAYETAIANLAPSLARRDLESVAQLLQCSDVPLATAEVVEIMRRPEQKLRDELVRCALASPAGADMYWSPPGRG